MQGEFVSVGRLEATYSGNSDLIHQMYIYGSSLRSYLLASVIPSPCKSHKAWSIADVLFASRKPLFEVAGSVSSRGCTATHMFPKAYAHVTADPWHGMCSGNIPVQWSGAEEGSEA